jgi:3-deoxy-manno-octulosonate cytidylyltransferase (CMP-KDO synthetase)
VSASKSHAKPNVIVLIPARYASSRFPGKPLAKIAGVTMIERVYKQSEKARNVSRVLVATDDERIREAVEGFGGQWVMTGSHHATGTDRLAEAAAGYDDDDIIVNVQGDEPLIDPMAIEALVEPLIADRSIEMSTTVFRISDKSEADNQQLVKVVVDHNSFAMYFSRQPIPFYRSDTAAEKRHYLGHMGLYAYTKRCLMRLASLPPTPMEQAEMLEQLRALENGIKIKVIQFETRSQAVDVPEDIAKVEKALQLSRV